MESYEEKSFEKEEKEQENRLETLASKEDQIGHIVQGEDSLSISLEEDTLVSCFVHKENRDIKVGSYVQIPLITRNDNYNKEILGIVKNLGYVKKSNTGEYNKDPSQNPADIVTEENYAMIAKIEPITIVDKNKYGEPNEARNISTVPKPHTRTYKSKDKEMLRTGLGIPEDGIPVGYMSNSGRKTPSDSPLVYKLKNPGHNEQGESILWRHSLICGSTGTGKTHTSKNIIRQLHQSSHYTTPALKEENQSEKAKKPNIIIIDPEGEYIDMRDDPELSSEDQKISTELESQGVEIGGVGNQELKVFRPEKLGKMNVRHSGEEESFHISFDIVRNREKLLLPFDAEMPTINVITTVIDVFFSNYEGPKTYENFIEWLQNEEFKDAKNTEDFKDKHNINDQSWKAANSRLNNKTFRSIFDQSDKSLKDKISNIVQPGQISVIPVNHLSNSQQKLVVMSLMAIIAENKLAMAQKDGETVKTEIEKTPIILALDEAHNYLSAGANNNVRDKYIMKKFIDIAKQGRKYKTGLLMITQNPEDIHQEIMKQTNTRFYMRLEGEILKNINEHPEIKNKVQNFDKGQMMVKSPGTRPIELQGFKICTTKHKN